MSKLAANAHRIAVPFDKFWDTFGKEPEQINTEISCFWNIANILSATTGTLQFLEKAINRWTTVEPPKALSLQYEEEINQQLVLFCSYRKSPEYRRA